MANLKTIVATINKTFKQDVAHMGHNVDDPERIPTGLFPLDLAIGGGFPLGRITLLYGMESSMKTTLALLAIANAQRMWPKKKAVFVDVEKLFGKKWAKSLGVDVENLIYVSPNNAEQVVDIVEAVLMAEDVSIVVIDSLAAMVTQTELDKTADEAIVGRTGLVINKLYRKASNALGKAVQEGRAPALIVLNQIRYKIGVMHGNPETMPGGPAFLFASSLTLRLRGQDVVDKSNNKTLPSFKEVSAVVKKHKIPIVQKSSVFAIAVIPNKPLNLGVGEAPAVNTVMQYFKALNLLEQGKGGYELTNPATGEVETYKKQDDIKQRFIEDKAWAAAIKSALIPRVMENDALIISAEDEKKADKASD